MKEKKKKKQEDIPVYIDENKKFLSGDYVLERIGITERTLFILAESGEFGAGKIAGKVIIDAESFFRYLDRSHFTRRTSESQEIAIDNKGKIREELTYVKKKHTTVPKMKKIEEFADRLGVIKRTFQRHCEEGLFTHYKIGTVYKMTEDEWTENIENIYREGSVWHDKLSVGRPNELKQTVAEYVKEIQDEEE